MDKKTGNKKNRDIDMSRVWAMPNAKTFKIKPIRELIGRVVKEYAEEVGRPIVVIDPFANEGSILEEFDGVEVEYITNDLDTQYDTDYHLEASEFISMFEDDSVDIVLYDPPYCYDKETDIFTKDGWKSITEVTKDDIVATLTDEGDMEWHNPTEVIENKYEGGMVKIDSQSVNLLVTPNHKMWVKKHFYGDFEYIDAENLYDKHLQVWFKKAPNPIKGRDEDVEFFTLPAVEFVKPNRYGERGKPDKLIPMDTWLKFLGTYLAEGSCDRTGTDYGVRLAQKDPEGRKFIIEMLDDLGFHYLTRRQEFTIYDKQLWSYVHPLGKSHDKYIPEEIKDAISLRQMKILFRTMQGFDGTNITYPKYNEDAEKWYSYTTNEYYTVSKRLADDVYELILNMGKGATISKNKGGVYRVRILKAKDFKVGKERYEIIENWKGKVYCVTVPNSKVLVKRKNRSVWCGNSPRQISEVYKEHGLSVNMQTTQASYWGNQKKNISLITKQGGKVITFGWNSGGIGKSNGFEIEEVLLVPHGGWHNDTICTVDERQ